MNSTQEQAWVKPTKGLFGVGDYIELLKEHGDGGVTTVMRLHHGVVVETDGWSHAYIEAGCWSCSRDVGKLHKCKPERVYFFFRDSFVRVLDKGRKDIKNIKKVMKFYRVKKDNFLWLTGAILKANDSDNGYRPISDIWDASEQTGNEYITKRIIENSPEWFERVYEVSLIGKVVYETKEKARELLSKAFKSE